MVTHIFNPSTWEAEAGECLILMATLSAELAPEKSELHRAALSQKKN